jgi:NADPH2:quinone reductase
MRIVRHHRPGPPSVLRVETTPVPEPGAGQALVRVEAIGVNSNAARRRSGEQQPPAPSPSAPLWPAAPGGDVVGIVTETGSDVTTVRPGDRVVAIVPAAAYADHVLAEARWLTALPHSLDPVAATILGAPAQVALTVLQTGRVAAGHRVLVHAGAGTIGHLAVQLARLLGAGTVAATAGSPEKLRYAHSCGAQVVADYSTADWVDRLRTAVPEGFDVIINGVGGGTVEHDLRLLAAFGTLVWFGAAGGTPAPVPPAALTGLHYLAGSSFAAWRQHRPEQVVANLHQLITWMAAGQLGTTIRAVVPLAEAARAHTLIEERGGTGRIVLVP